MIEGIVITKLKQIEDERVTKSNEEIKERIRALEKWVWGAAAVLTAFVVAGTIVGELNLIPNSNDNTVHTN